MGQTTLSERLRAVESEIAAGRPERALELCQQVATHFPRALAVQRVLGEVYLALRKPREALGALDRALEGNPEDARACCARAIVHQLHGNAAGALEFYRRACDINPDDQVLRAAYRELAASLGQPPYQPTRRGLARLYLRGDLLPHAAREWETLIAEQPDSLEAQVGLAETLWRSGDLRATEERCRRIVVNAPSCIKPLLILAVMAHDSGNADEAQRLVRRARELDPDMRIAQTLLADRLAAEDRPLRALILGDDAPFDGAISQTLPPHARDRQRGWSRPLVERHTGGPVAQPIPSAPDSTALPGAGALTGPTGAMPAPTPRRATSQPHDIRSMFAETEYMLWSREDTEHMDAARLPQAPAPRADTPPVERGGGSSVLVPPALRDQGFSLEETEARAAINWVSWLQAQGARARDAQVSAAAAGMPDELATSTGISSGGAAPARQTGPLQQATPEALRQMFEVLNSDTASVRVVEADAGPSRGPSPTVPRQRDTMPIAADATDDLLPASPSAQFGVVEPGNSWADVADAWQPDLNEAGMPGRDQHDATAGIGEDAAPLSEPDIAAFHGGWGDVPALQQGTEPPARGPEPDVDELRDASGPLTIEALEEGFAKSGFQSLDLQPGSLARIASASHPLAADAPDAQPEAVHVPAFSEPSDPTFTPSGPLTSYSLGEDDPQMDEARPAPDDYPARLEQARRWRADGRGQEAMAEYRTILRNAPDLLAGVMGDLQAILAEQPDDGEAHRLMGDALVRQGDYIRALESYNRAVALGDGQQ